MIQSVAEEVWRRKQPAGLGAPDAAGDDKAPPEAVAAAEVADPLPDVESEGVKEPPAAMPPASAEPLKKTAKRSVPSPILPSSGSSEAFAQLGQLSWHGYSPAASTLGGQLLVVAKLSIRKIWVISKQQQA